MYGRYGYDTLGKTMLVAYAVLLLSYTVISIFYNSALLYVFYLIASFALAIGIISRAFSKNITKRRAENEKFCGFFKLRRNKWRDRKTHIYRKCPSCRAVLRLPKAKGKHTVVCPVCKKRFDVK